MSTYIYLVCRDHSPAIRADDESGQHLYDLPQLRQDIADRPAIVIATSMDCWPAERYRCSTARFFRQHPTCRLGIEDEYGREHPIEEESEDR